MAQLRAKQPSKWEQANLLSKLLWFWMDGVFMTGKKRPLSFDDLHLLPKDIRSAELYAKFERIWSEQQNAYDQQRPFPFKTFPWVKPTKIKPPSVVWTLHKLFGRRLYPVGILCWICDNSILISPLVLQALVNFVVSSQTGSPPPAGTGVLLAFGMFLVPILTSLTLNWYFAQITVTGMAARSVLSSAVFHKSMRLSPEARQKYDSGKIATILATDVARVELFFSWFHDLWCMPVNILTNIGILLALLGPSALAGVVIIFLLGPIQAFITTLRMRYRKDLVEITDKRVKLTQEILQGIRVVKFFHWEPTFLERIFSQRSAELKKVASVNMIEGVNSTIGFVVPVTASIVTFVVYSLTTDSFNASTIFSALSLFNALRIPAFIFPMIFSSFADAKVAIDRLQEFLEAPEIDFEPTVDKAMEPSVSIDRGEFVWCPPYAEPATPLPANNKSRLRFAFPKKQAVPAKALESETFDRKDHEPEMAGEHADSESDAIAAPETQGRLSSVNIQLKRGSLCAVVGPVGSGKSSLLSALVGDMQYRSGSVTFSGSVGLCPQQAWIMNATIEENILFGKQMDREKYARCVQACALTRDFEILPGGDQTEVGEKGINLSGGQKQRISLARLAYSDADIVLLDDPLSAVDAHVGRHIFDNLILKALGGKTRVLVTHQLHCLPQCDYIIIMQQGRIAEQGSFQELMSQSSVLAGLMKEYGGVHETPSEQTESKKQEGKELEIDDRTDEPEEKSGRKLIQEEERMTGGIGRIVLKKYFSAMGHPYFFGAIIVTLIFTQGLRVSTDYWLVIWSSMLLPSLSQNGYIGIYVALGLTASAVTLVYYYLCVMGGVRAARTMHEWALTRVLKSPISFFDTTPLGRIVNRLSRDQDIVDNSLIKVSSGFALSVATLLSTLITIGVSTQGWLILVMAPMAGLYYYIQKLYRTSSIQLKRMESISKSPLFAHFTMTLSGMTTIRAYNQQDRFQAKAHTLIDSNNEPQFLIFHGQRWMSIRLDLIGSILILVVSIYAVIFRTTISSAVIGLMLSYCLQVNMQLNQCMRTFTDLEMQLNAVERLEYYSSQLVIEDDAATVHPPDNWPSNGSITFEGVEMRYQPDMPLVLNAVSIDILPRAKIGVVGRTGSGKSSLMFVLFRMVNPCGGRILIDGIDICQLSLRDLRSRITIIPQDPILFSGSIRTNLDPFSEHSDSDLWDVLARSGLKAAVTAMDGKLDATVASLGENLSVGQRQLMCLARAMLRRPRVIILDECTANVDFETDKLIQSSLREDFRGSTVLTIAHRLNTIVDYDKILVLDTGNVVEYDSPRVLLQNKASEFSRLVDETGQANAAVLRSMAAKEE
ncbi:P-loop containing nucleoside triphosphate hydrolase protein [Polychytrium aggregatum]|uniref:P-loop containing nucleoside triphosphate hydrolase protein n=1 Tax=Polychytrium aggregatum TaxID=110093 RepID=UPI0022FDDA71|nr:P-loop containing nucleoside triphosphate hydrolase protein [Polychytrium aggregatum]KAI9197309.1 P-loop containing nucleoside triphosphate hydrolase protein [Polychytrium aggregatum]